jgi:hypothetical protein
MDVDEKKKEERGTRGPGAQYQHKSEPRKASDDSYRRHAAGVEGVSGVRLSPAVPAGWSRGAPHTRAQGRACQLRLHSASLSPDMP